MDRDEPDGGWFSVQTDFAGRSVYAENPYGDSETWSYVGSQLRHREFASGGTALAHQTWGYDAAGRMDVRFGPVDPTTYAATPSPDPTSGDYAFGYTYSDAGRLLSREGPNDLTTWDWQDGVRVGEDVSGVSSTDFDYAADTPRLMGKAIGAGSTWRTTDYVYDALGRLAEAEIDDGGEVVTQTWSNRDVYGRPRAQSRAINGAIESSSTLATDLRGRITDVSLFTPTRTGQAAYQYTANGELAVVQSRWASGGTWGLTRGLRYGHAGPEGELTGITDYSSGSTYASVSSRDVLGRATEIELQGGALVEQEFDLMGRVDWRRATKGGGNWRLQDYSYDARSRVDGVTTSDVSGTLSTGTFYYDEPGWLTQEVHTDASGTRTIDYGYDVAGNRLSRVETTGTGSTSRAYTYGYGNVLATVDGSSVSWNAFGETITDHRGADIDRAGDGAEVGVTDSAGVPLYGFTRGPGGEAVEVEEAATGDLRSFLWGPAEADFPVSTLDESGADQAYVAIEGMVVGRLDGGAFVPMGEGRVGERMRAQAARPGRHGRGSGTQRAGGPPYVSTVARESTGQLGDFLDAGLAFGEDSAAASGSPERRVWALLESLPGTTYKLPRRRLYDEETGRFASQDPIGLAGGDHRFAYLNGDPMGGVDPSGLMGVNRIAPFTRDGAPLGWDPTTTGKSIPAWMRAGRGNEPPAWMGIDTPGCGNDPFCIREEGEKPAETEEAEGEVDAGAGGWTTDENGVQWRAGDEGMDVLVTPDEEQQSGGGGVMWSDAGGDSTNEKEGGVDLSSPTWGLDAAAAGADWASGVELSGGGTTSVRTPTAREQALCATLDDPLSRKLSLGYSMRQGRPMKLTPGDLDRLRLFPEGNVVRTVLDDQLKRGFSEIRNHQPAGGPLTIQGALDTASGATTNKTGIQIEGSALVGADGLFAAFRGKMRVFESLDFDNFESKQGGSRDRLTRLGFALMYPYGEAYRVTSDWYPLTIDAQGWRTTMPGFGVGGDPTAWTNQNAEMAAVVIPAGDGVAGAVGGTKFGGGRGGVNLGDVAAAGGGILAFGAVSAAGERCAAEVYAAHQPGGGVRSMSQKAAVGWILVGVAGALGGLWGIDKAPALWCASLSRLAPRELERLVLLGKAEIFCVGEPSKYVRYVARVQCLDEGCGGLWLPGETILNTPDDIDPNGGEQKRRVVEAHNVCSGSVGTVGRYIEGPDGWYVMAQRCGGDLFLSYNWQRPLSEMPWMQNAPP